MLTRLWLIALREIKAYLADRADLAFSLLLPVVILALLIGAFGGSTSFHGTAHFVDHDGGPAAQALLARMRAIDGLQVKLLSSANAQQLLDHSSILMYTEIPPGFSVGLASGVPVQLIEYQRGNGAQADQIVAGYIAGAAQRLGADATVRAQVVSILDSAGARLPDNQIQTATSAAVREAEASPAVAVVSENTKVSVDYAEKMFPGIVVMFALFAITLNAQSLVQQRHQGTFERLQTTRLTAPEFLLGLFLGNIGRGMIQVTVLFALAALTLSFFTISTFVWSFLFGVLVVVAASGLSLLIAVVVRSQEQARWLPIFFTMLMTIFGGTFFSVTEGTTLGRIAQATVTFWANDGFSRILTEGATLADIAGPVAVMAGVAVVGLLVSQVVFARTARRAMT